MPKTTKEATEKKDKNLNSKSSSSNKKTSSKAVATTKKKASTTSAKSSMKKSAPKTSAKSKTTVSKKSTSTKKTPSKKQTKAVKTKKTAKSKKVIANALEYYDLPYRYNETIVKILAQTPKALFVYWDISDDDRKNYINQYGNDFFEKTKPILIIHNTTMNYSFEIEINDFANCWYFNINDEKCEYTVELGRKPKDFNENTLQVPNNYLYITSSNKIESPNGHILFEKSQNVVFYKDVKTNRTYSKDVTNMEFMKYLGKAYSTYAIYKKIYNDEQILDINNPTSSFK